MFHFFTIDWEKNNKNHFHRVEIGNYILIYIKIKRVFLDSLIKSIYLFIYYVLIMYLCINYVLIM